jgi:hypothetical protein
MITHRKKHQTDDPKTWPSKEVMAGERDAYLKVAFDAGKVADRLAPILGEMNRALVGATTHVWPTTVQEFLDGHAKRKEIIDRIAPTERQYDKAKRLRQSSFVKANILARRIGAVEHKADAVRKAVDQEKAAQE